MHYDQDYDPDDIQTKVSEMLIATADNSDELIDDAVPNVLKLLRDKMKMDVVFVSEFTDGRRKFKHVAQTPGKEVIQEGASDPVEESWCQYVVDGRLPEFIPDGQKVQDEGKAPKTGIPIGTHLSTPIVLNDGSVYGTLCCFSFGKNDTVSERDLKNLRMTAKLTASRIDAEQGHSAKAPLAARAPAAPDLSLQPMTPNDGGFKRAH